MRYPVLILCFQILPLLVQGQTGATKTTSSITEETKTVIVTGVGSDRDGAIRQGLRSAVEKAIGVYLKTESVVENFDLISDKILTHSRGYVRSYDILRERTEGGLIFLSISAEVIVKQLESTLIELQLYSKEIEGKSLFAEAATKIAESRSAMKLFQDLRTEYPRNAITVTFGEPDIQTAATDIVTISIPYTIGWNEAFLAELVEILNESAHGIANSSRERRSMDEDYPLKSHARIDLKKSRYYIPIAAGKELFYRIQGDEYGQIILLSVFASLNDKNGKSIKSKIQRGRMTLLNPKVNPRKSDYIYFEFVTSPEVQNHLGGPHGGRPAYPFKFRVTLDELNQISTISGYAVNPLDR